MKAGESSGNEKLEAHNPKNLTMFAMDLAAKNGHLDVVAFLHHNQTEGCTEFAMDLAAMNGHLPVVAFLHQNRTEGCTRVCH
ncbi:MAG: ankyrin repeat domain-containing protein [Sulfobacillus sp.]